MFTEIEVKFFKFSRRSPCLVQTHTQSYEIQNLILEQKHSSLMNLTRWSNGFHETTQIPTNGESFISKLACHIYNFELPSYRKLNCQTRRYRHKLKEKLNSKTTNFLLKVLISSRIKGVKHMILWREYPHFLCQQRKFSEPQQKSNKSA